jgi:hypothetical protein
MPQNDRAELFERIYKELYSKDLLQEIKNHAAELVEYFMETNDAPPSSWEELPEDWLGEVYAAIAAGLGSDFEPPPDNALFNADAKDRESVGHAFSQMLVPAGSINRLVELCQEHKITRVSEQELMLLKRESDVEAGGDLAVELAAFGLTPTHLVLATDAIALFLERAIDADFFPIGRQLYSF